jgi:xanthine dehydrogenase YagR molybdenum-binding subunit
VSLVHADRNTPGFMRSPPEVPYLFALESAMDELAVALESAMDELAVALDMDPIELRRRNDTMRADQRPPLYQPLARPLL